MDKTLIDRFEQGGQKLKDAVAGLTPVDLTAFPVPGTWSIHQIVIHLADSDLVATDRMKRVIAEDNPSLLGYDETKFVANLHYHDQPVSDALTIFDLNRKQMSRVLRLLPEATFNRTGNHSERGEMTLTQLIQTYVNHLDHHLKFIHEKRNKLGKKI